MTPTDEAPQWDDVARRVGHRPWPLPSRPWLVTQTWSELLFAHWQFAPATVRGLLPPPLAPTLDTFAGQAWVGLVPFQLSRLGPRGIPDPLRFAFPELNLRTYISVGGKPGVWFFSLDAANPLAVLAGRVVLHMPYHWARLQWREGDGWVSVASRRRRAVEASFAGRYRPAGPVALAAPGSLEHWLTERYCLYAMGRTGHVTRIEVHHDQWPLQAATADLSDTLVAAVAGLALPGQPPLLHFARRVDVLTWAPERVSPAELAASDAPD